MKKIWMLSFANIRKTKSQTISLLLLFVISAMLLNAGMLVFSSFGNYFDRLAKELNTSDFYCVVDNTAYTDQVASYFDHNKNISQMQQMQSVWITGETQYDGKKHSFTFMLNDADKSRELSQWKFIGKHESLDDDLSIYLPYVFQFDGGYEINDKITLTFDNQTLSFTIKGFTEDVFFSSTDTGLLSGYISNNTFKKISQQYKNYGCTVTFINSPLSYKKIESDIREMIGGKESSISLNGNTIFSIDKSLIKFSRTMMPSMIAVMTVCFSAIICIVCLLIVRFRIGNNIEEDMPKIGSLKAIGYTSRQIAFSIVTQFSVIALLGSMLGIITSYLLIPGLSDVFAAQSGLRWTQGFDGGISLTALCGILFVVIAVAFFTTRRIHRINPIVALRGGIITHSFRKNHLPLDHTKGNLPAVLSIKSILQNKKQSIMIFFIMIAVAFSGTFAVVMFYNTVIDITTFKEIPGIEISNAVANFEPNQDTDTLLNEIENKKEVRKAQYLDAASLDIDHNNIRTYVMKDYGKKETITLYEGRYPLHNNELAISGPLSETLQKTIGDTVTIYFENKEKKYLITGLTQGANMDGMMASITLEGIRAITPNFHPEALQIYLKDNVDAGKFIKTLEKEYGDKVLYTVDMNQEVENGVAAYTSIVSKVGIAIIIISSFVVILVLYFIINSSIIRKKRELGIQKAIGFTTLQLMHQMSIGFIIPISLGVIMGCLIGATECNSLMSVAQRSMGIMRANYIIHPAWIVGFGIITLIISYITSMLITRRIKKISAYSLVTE